jgi:hypothetical protein
MKISEERKEELRHTYRVGSFLRKNNFQPFKLPTHQTVACIKIKRIKFGNKQIVINGTMQFHLSENLPIVISKEQALDFESKWIQIKYELDNIQESRRKEFEHFREDNGQAKKALNRGNAKAILFKYRQQNPEGNYEVYTCTHCGEIHIGKVLPELIDTPNL